MVDYRETIGKSEKEQTGGILGDLSGTVTDAADTVTDAATDFGSDVGSTVDNTVDDFTGGVDDAIDDAQDTLDDTVGSIDDTIDETVGDVEDTVGDTVGDIGGGIDDAVDTVDETVDETVGDIASGSGAIFDNVERTAENTVGSIEDTVDETVGDIEDTVGGTADDLFEDAENVFEDTQDAFGDVAGGVEDTTEDLQDSFDDALSGVDETIDDTVSGVDETVGDIGESFDDIASGAQDTFADITPDVEAPDVDGVLSDLTGEAGGLVDDVTDAVGNLGSSAGGLAGDLAGGIFGGAGYLADAASGVEGIIQGVGQASQDLVGGGGQTDQQSNADGTPQGQTQWSEPQEVGTERGAVIFRQSNNSSGEVRYFAFGESSGGRLVAYGNNNRAVPVESVDSYGELPNFSTEEGARAAVPGQPQGDTGGSQGTDATGGSEDTQQDPSESAQGNEAPQDQQNWSEPEQVNTAERAVILKQESESGDTRFLAITQNGDDEKFAIGPEPNLVPLQGVDTFDELPTYDTEQAAVDAALALFNQQDSQEAAGGPDRGWREPERVDAVGSVAILKQVDQEDSRERFFDIVSLPNGTVVALNGPSDAVPVANAESYDDLPSFENKDSAMTVAQAFTEENPEADQGEPPTAGETTESGDLSNGGQQQQNEGLGASLPVSPKTLAAGAGLAFFGITSLSGDKNSKKKGKKKSKKGSNSSSMSTGPTAGSKNGKKGGM